MSLRIAAYLLLLASCGSNASPGADDPGARAPIASIAPPPAPPPAPLPRGSISAGGEHVCAIVSGRVACWGHASAGQLGPSITADQPSPVNVEGLTDMAGVDAGSRGTCAWSTRGDVWCWGSFGRRPPQPIARVPGVTGAIQVVVDDGLACALGRDGRVTCWATDPDACHGPEAAAPAAGTARLRRAAPPPTPVACGPHEIRLIASGASELAIAGWHACALTAAGMWCWTGAAGEPFAIANTAGATSLAGARQRRMYGEIFSADHNFYALLGDHVAGWTIDLSVGRSRPAAFHPVDSGARRIDAGYNEVCAIGSAATCWTYDRKRRDLALAGVDLGVGATVRCARRTDNRVACWGATGLIGDGTRDDLTTPVEVADITDAVQLEGDDGRACVRRANGRVACWGTRFDEGVDAVPADAGVSGAVDLVVSFAHACIRRGDGTTACWGRDNAGAAYGPPLPPTNIPRLAGALRLSADAWTTCAIRADHSVVCHGDGRRAVPPEPTLQLWHASDLSCRRRPDRSVVCESTFGGPLALGADIVRLAIADGSVCVIRTSGAVDCYSDYLRAPPRRIPGLDDAIAIASGGLGDRTCAVRAGGTVTCWNQSARNDGQPPPLAPVVVPHLSDAIGVAAGWSYACALRRTGRVACWGRPDHLGDGSRSRREVPVLVPSLAPVPVPAPSPPPK